MFEHDIKPVLAVVPNNRDSNLNVDSVDDQFWNKLKKYQSLKWTIALHGNTHELIDYKDSDVFFSKLTEFTNLKYHEQDSKIKKGLLKFSKNDISCDMFIAPAHSFNATTLAVLKDNGFKSVSDGMFLYPFLDKTYQLIRYPQQIWAFRRPWFGNWTVCCHHNNWNDLKISQFEKYVIDNKANIVSINDLVVRNNFICQQR